MMNTPQYMYIQIRSLRYGLGNQYCTTWFMQSDRKNTFLQETYEKLANNSELREQLGILLLVEGWFLVAPDTPEPNSEDEYSELPWLPVGDVLSDVYPWIELVWYKKGGIDDISLDDEVEAIIAFAKGCHAARQLNGTATPELLFLITTVNPIEYGYIIPMDNVLKDSQMHTILSKLLNNTSPKYCFYMNLESKYCPKYFSPNADGNFSEYAMNVWGYPADHPSTSYTRSEYRPFQDTTYRIPHDHDNVLHSLLQTADKLHDTAICNATLSKCETPRGISEETIEQYYI